MPRIGKDNDIEAETDWDDSMSYEEGSEGEMQSGGAS
uniref:Uncharacterized protein n=1 Tax=Arundo donax TaxID=35708 RepID=A0A0A9EHM0_ARUDO